MLLSDEPTKPGWPRCGPGGRVVAEPTRRAARRGGRRHRRHRRPAGLRPEAAALVASLDDVPVVAVDVPSGVGVDDGGLDGPHVRAAVTVTFGTHKLATSSIRPRRARRGSPGRHRPGPAAGAREALQSADVAALLPGPDAGAHKYTRGVVGVRAGRGVPGRRGALRCRRLFRPGRHGPVRRRRRGRPGPRRAPRGGGRRAGCRPGSWGPVAVRAPAPRLRRVGTACRWSSTPTGSRTWTARSESRRCSPRMPASWPRCSASPATGSRPDTPVGTEAAERFDGVVLLKGRHTLVAPPGRRVRVNTSACRGWPPPGAGDVLAGLIGALLAAGLAPYDAARWVPGCTAPRRAGRRGGPLVARGMARTIPARSGCCSPLSCLSARIEDGPP